MQKTIFMLALFLITGAVAVQAQAKHGFSFPVAAYSNSSLQDRHPGQDLARPGRERRDRGDGRQPISVAEPGTFMLVLTTLGLFGAVSIVRRRTQYQ